MIEFWDYLLQFFAVAAGFCAALRAYLKSRRQPWFLLTCFYGTFALGTLYWTLHLLLRQETPQIFYVSDLAWLASYVFLLALTLTLADPEERQSRTGLCWLAPVFCLPQFVLYVTYGDLLLNVLMCGLTMMLAWCAMRGLVWAKRTENGRLRRFHGTVLAFTASSSRYCFERQNSFPLCVSKSSRSTMMRIVGLPNCFLHRKTSWRARNSIV